LRVGRIALDYPLKTPNIHDICVYTFCVIKEYKLSKMWNNFILIRQRTEERQRDERMKE
jgi:hypothetical protein